MHSHPARIAAFAAFAAFAALVLNARDALGQFNVPLPAPTSSERVFREDMQMLFHGYLFPSVTGYADRVDSLRARALGARTTTRDRTALAADAGRFCTERFGTPNVQSKTPLAQCEVALTPDSLLRRFGDTELTAEPLHRTYVRSWIPMYFTSRPYVAEYLRESGGAGAFAVASQFAANVGENEAYLVATVVRGLVGRGILSVDQALVVTRSGDPDPAKREAIESDKANALRAINNGGTLVARYTMPMYARSGSTMSSAVGLTVSAGVLGAISGEDRRTGAGSSALEWLMSFPVRDIGGNASVLADFMVGFRGGYTRAGRSLLESGGTRDVGFGQMIVGLRQNGTISVSALATVANHGINELVPRLAVNFAARR